VILDRIWAPGPEARLLPAEKLHAPTVAVMAIMTFAMIVVAAAGLALANAASVVTTGVESKYVVEVPAAAASELPRVVAAAHSVPGVRSVTPVPESEMRHTLQRWLGEAASSRDLPVPSLVMVDLGDPAASAALAMAVRAQVPQATVVAQTAELRPLLRSIEALQWLALALVLLMALATSAAIILAARGVLDTHRSTVQIMHGIGATDAQVTKLFERKIAVDAVAGAGLGLAAALAILLLIGGGLVAAAGDLTSTAPLHLADAVALGLVPVGAVILAVAVAHRTLLRALRSNL
jgi:cell division transport system permease protein